jgi:hypothetical protein
MAVAVEESGGVPSFSVAVGGWEASREGRWRRERGTRAWTRRTGRKSRTGSGRRLLWWPGGATETKGQGSGVEGGSGGELRPRGAGRRWRGAGVRPAAGPRHGGAVLSSAGQGSGVSVEGGMGGAT